MGLEVKSRICENVHIVECKGHIVAGAEGDALEAILRKDGARNLKQVVLHLGEVNRLDSMGLGLIMRHTTALRQRGGDLRLSHVLPVILDIFQLTRIDTVLKIFPTEDDALLSFLQRAADAPGNHCPAGSVLLVEQTPDFCAFTSALLTQHGYSVKIASVVRDARILLMVNKFDFILAGPSTRPDALETTLGTFRSLAPKAKVLAIEPAMKGLDPHHAGDSLLQLLGAGLASPTKSAS
jgi:anti-anti-sigma factor